MTNMASIFKGASRVTLKTTYLKVKLQDTNILFHKYEKKKEKRNELMITGISMTYWDIITTALLDGSHS